MKKLIFILFLAISAISSFAQTNFGQPKDSANFEVNIHPDFFLLGVFSDYVGIVHFIDRENQIDQFEPYEENLAKYINHYIHSNYNIEGELKFDIAKHSALYSPLLVKKLQSEYYDKEGNLLDNKIDNDEKNIRFY